MEKNGELDSSSMAVDPVSPASNNSKDLLDEPAAPRRNSTDDIDPSRPRKRLAAMAIHDDVKDVTITAEASRQVSSLHLDKAADIVAQRHESGGDDDDAQGLGQNQVELEAWEQEAGEGEESQKGRGNNSQPIEGVGKPLTIHLRSPGLPLPEETDNDAIDGNNSSAGSHSASNLSEELKNSNPSQVGSPNGSLRSPEIEIEEVEDMDEDDDLTSHVTILDNYLNNPVNTGGPERVKEIMDSIVSKLERDPAPLRELDEMVVSIVNLIAAVGDHMDVFWKAYTTNHDIWMHLPGLVDTLLKRTEPFGGNFFRRINGFTGIEILARLFGEFARLTALFVRYDVWVMSESPLDVEITLISCAYQRTLSFILRPNHLFSLFERAYNVYLNRALPDLLRDFIERTDGLKLLESFQELLFRRMPSQPKLAASVYCGVDLLSKTVRSLDHMARDGFPEGDMGDLEEAVTAVGIPMLKTAESILATILESHLQVLHIKEFTITMESLCQLTTGLYKLNALDPNTRVLIQEKTNFRYIDIDPNELPSLAEWSCRFPVLLKMMMCSRMDFRLHGLVRATDLLVRAWRETSSQCDWQDSKLLRYLADFILENKVIEYIMGPESHHELIRRSANITGFLLVTHTITPGIHQALWQPIVENKDPRVFQATLAMHQDMITNMNLATLVSLSEKLNALPFSSFDTHVIDFVCRLMEQIKSNIYSHQQHQQQHQPHLDELRLEPAPFELLIGLIRMASHEEDKPTLDTGLSAPAIFDFAARELRSLTGYGPVGAARREIFLECINDIKAINPSATGSISVILAFLQNRPPTLRAGSPTYTEDVDYLVSELKLAELLIEELGGFVESHRDKDQVSRLRRLKLRLELLQFIISTCPDCFPPGLDEKLWTYVVGASALGHSERDAGFEFYISHFTNIRSRFDPILENAFRKYFPALDPAYFSSHVLNFCKMSIEYLNRSLERLHDSMDGDGINLDGMEQLWRIILEANNEILASDASTYLVNFYLDSRAVISRPASIEATHFKIVERCIEQLNSAASSTNGRSASADDSQMALDIMKDRNDNKLERIFLRSLNLLDQFVKGYKVRSEYNKGVHDSAQSPTVEMTTGVPLTLRLRWHGVNYQSPTHTFKIGNLDTGQDLHDRISRLVGGEKHRTILAGRELKLSEDPMKTLKDFGVRDGAFLIVQKAPDQGSNTVTVRPSSNLNALEAEIMRHFDALYELLALPEPQAARIWVFLRNLPVHDHLKAKMLSGESWSQSLPAEQPYKILYFLYTLRACFGEQRQQQASSNFVTSAISRLLETLMLDKLESQTKYTLSTRAQVTNELLDCLRMFLEESVAEENPASYLTNGEAFVERMLSILKTFSEQEYTSCLTSDDCVVNAFRALLRASRIDRRTWLALTDKQLQMYEIVARFLVHDDRLKVRQGVSNAITSTFQSSLRSGSSGNGTPCEDFARFFWELLETLLTKDAVNPDSCAEIFQTAFVLFKYLGTTDINSLNLESYLRLWSSRLITYPVSEVVGRPKEDFIVTGLSRLLAQCTELARDQGIVVQLGLSERIFGNLLFPSLGYRPGAGSPIERLPCLHGPTRAEIYSLLLQLVNDPESCTRMVMLNKQLFPRDESLHDNHTADRSRWARSSAGHVGLQNMSNTCYLNSLLAQLFMNRPFRSFILDMDVNHVDESQRLLYSMKVLFARMQNSYLKAVEPKDFVEAITDYEGEPIDISIQMDVDEFYNLVFDRLEGQMSSMEMKSTFRGYYGGQLVQQVKSTECKHISERNEPFSAIQCDIKGKTNLQESLKAYVGGEVMDGENKYSCTECGRHVDAVKRTSLKDLPNGIIFHLKRFEFDLQTMHRSKINDKFEFPTCIDMTPYTTDFLGGCEGGEVAPSPDIFELVGVLVHSGTAESGHYYSYVRDRLSDPSAPQWLEFNDSEVSFFDPSTIASACYGGCDSMARDNMGQTFAVNKPYSAYMLFYERSSFSRSLPSSFGAADFGSKLPIPSDLEMEICMENDRFIRKYCMFDNSYLDFVKKLVDLQYRLSRNAAHPDHSSDRKALILGLEAFEQIATRFKDPAETESLSGSLQAYILNCPECSIDFIRWLCEKDDAIRNLLVCNPYLKPRQVIGKLALVALTQIRRKRPAVYGLDDNSHDPEFGPQETDSILYHFCSSLLASWDGLQYSSKTWNDFFSLLAAVAALGQFEKVTMLELGILRKTLEMLLVDHLPVPRKMEFIFDNFTKIWNKRRPPLTNVGILLCELMTMCDVNLLPCQDGEIRVPDPSTSRYPLTKIELEYFTFRDDRNSMTVLTRLLESHTVNEPISNLIADIVKSELSPSEGPLLEMIKMTLLNGVPVDPAQEALPFLTGLLHFSSQTKSIGYVRDIIRRVAEEIPTIGSDGGLEHLSFFRDISRIRNPYLKTIGVRVRLLEFVGSWAPPLLLYCDADVREETEMFLDEILFTPLVNGNDRPKARKAVEDLMNDSFVYMENRYPKQRHQCEEKTFDSILRVLEKCGEYQADEETFRARMDGLRHLIEKLILEEEEEADLASDDWGGSEIGSDTHEMEVQLDDYGSN